MPCAGTRAALPRALWDKKGVVCVWFGKTNLILVLLQFQEHGTLTTFPQCNFSLEFRDLLSQNYICYQWLSVFGIYKIIHRGILDNMPYLKMSTLTCTCIERNIQKSLTVRNRMVRLWTFRKTQKISCRVWMAGPWFAVPCWALATIWKAIFPMSLSAFEYNLYCMWLWDFTKKFKLI